MSMNDNTNAQVYPTACGGTIQNPENYPSAVFQGKRIFFCTEACLKAFEADPDRFMASEIEHPLDSE